MAAKWRWSAYVPTYPPAISRLSVEVEATNGPNPCILVGCVDGRSLPLHHAVRMDLGGEAGSLLTFEDVLNICGTDDGCHPLSRVMSVGPPWVSVIFL